MRWFKRRPKRLLHDFSEILDDLVQERGEPETLEAAFDLVTEAGRMMMFIRHHDYGADNINQGGEEGIAIRVGDKLARIKTILAKGKAKSESKEDAWADMSNYGKIGVLWGRGWWNLPEERPGLVVVVPKRSS